MYGRKAREEKAVAPTFVGEIKNVSVTEGGRARFECRVEGTPTPTVKWKKNGEVITASSRVRVSDMYGAHSLVISRTEHADTGVYSAVATNSSGSQESSANLSLKDSPYEPSPSKGRRSVNSASPSYSSSASPATSNISSPSHSPKAGRANMSRNITSNSPWNVDLKKQGTNASTPPRRRAPGFILRPRPQTVAVGEKLILKCSLLGYPTPNVTWEKEFRKLDESTTNGRVVTRNEGSDYYLEIAKVALSDSGKYTVIAKNNLGKQNAIVDISVSGTAGTAGRTTQYGNGYKSKIEQKNDIDDSINNNKSSSKISRIEISNSRNRSKDDKSNGRLPHDKITKTMDIKLESKNTSKINNEDASYGSSRIKRSQGTAPTFLKRLASTQVLEGEDLSLSCEIQGSPTPDLTWTKNGEKIALKSDVVSSDFTDGRAVLEIKNVGLSHAGEYICIAKNDTGENKCSSRVTVKGKAKKMKPEFFSKLKDTRITEGETLTLEAEVKGHPEPEVMWSLDGQEIPNAEVMYRGNMAKIVLRNVTYESSGQYMCTAMNEHGVDSVACRVRIKQQRNDTPPEFSNPLSDRKLKQGEDVTLRCEVSGTPEPKIKWLYNDEILEEEEGITISFKGGMAKLFIDHATTEDTGCYTCLAVNSAGKATTSCQVVVKETKREPRQEMKPPSFTTRFDDYSRKSEGESLTLECNVAGSPAPQVSWTINNKHIENSQTSFENGVARITINSLSSTSHSGSIACIAKNSSGEVKQEGRISIRAARAPPAIVKELPTELEVNEGEEATIKCEVSGHPQPRVVWTRDGRSLSVLSAETSYENGVASVRIRKASTHDGGRYVCSARNISGEVSSTCKVVINKKNFDQSPQFEELLRDLTIVDGTDLKLSCKVNGKPTPKITWLLDGQKVLPEDGEQTYDNGVATLVLEDAMPEDSGKYECVAKNSVGEAKSSCMVTVKEKAPKVVEEGPSFPIQLEDTTVNEGKDIILKCQVKGQPRPTIKWLLDGDPVTEADMKYAKDGTAQLILPQALPEDEGCYTCIAENPISRVMCSCSVTVQVAPKAPKKKLEKQTKVEQAPKAQEIVTKKIAPKYEASRQEESDDDEIERSTPERKPQVIEHLKDVTVPDGSINYKMQCKVTGTPPPQARWFVNGQAIEESDDFKFETDGDIRSLVFNEIFPDDSGEYVCVLSNVAGEDKTTCTINVEEIDGEPPNFLLKPRPLTVNAEEVATFTCKVDGDPTPTVVWLYCNNPIVKGERVSIETPNAENNYTHTLQVLDAKIEDAGRYAACAKNLLGDVTCTVSLIVNTAKNVEAQKDFRNVLKKSNSTPKSPKSPEPLGDQVDFRGVLKRQVEPTKKEIAAAKQDDFRDVLQKSSHTKVLSEEERKKQTAAQKDFRANLVRKVDTKVTSHDQIRLKSPEQKDFRDEALRTTVKTKAYDEEQVKRKRAEQKDFRDEALKNKVVTKAYKEEIVKTKRADQVDFRDVLSPTKRSVIDVKEDEPRKTEPISTPSNAATGKIKLSRDKMDHNTVATRRTRQRGGGEKAVEKESSLQQPAITKPVFKTPLKDITVEDSQPFELMCRVVGKPRPQINWFLGDEAIVAEVGITITHEGDVCKLIIAESFPDDAGEYVCKAENEHGVVTCSANVTVIGDDAAPQSKAPFYKKQGSLDLEQLVKPRIESGPQDMTIIRGNPISLCCTIKGSQPIKCIWRRGRDEIHQDRLCNIDTTNTSTALTIIKSSRDDSGCYTLQVKNAVGVDQFSVNVSIVDVPDAPGKPYVTDITSSSLVLSWYGSGYDGGSSIKSYKIEMFDPKRKWHSIASTNSTSYTVIGLKEKTNYQFRLRSENAYGCSEPSEPSAKVTTIVHVEENHDVSSDEDEEAFVEHGHVVIKNQGNFNERYTIGERLGQGRFGKVHRVTDAESGKQFAAKIMRALKAKDREAVQMEIDLMNSLRHPRLVQLIDAYICGREITMVMDLVSGGELFERVIDDDFELTEAACIKYMRQICDGLKYMHNHAKILHLDLKPENIMCINKTGTQIKIIDFGLARRFDPKETVRVMFGTPEFVAPEVINYDAIGFQTDMWSVGVICYILLSGLSPFMGDNDAETLSNITAVEWDFDDESFDAISEDAKDFIMKLLVKSIKKRFTVDQALNHVWLKKDTDKMKKSKLNTKNLRRFMARRKWQKTGNAVRALGRLASLAKLGISKPNSPQINGGGPPRESGFLASLKAQLLRENEEENINENYKPMFDELFDDIEVIEGSAAMFQCTIHGTPDPEVMWLKDGEPIKENRHYKVSYTEDNVCKLLIMDATLSDEAEYTCKAVNCEGETEHSAELIVITTDRSSTFLSSSTKTFVSTSPPASSTDSSMWALPGSDVMFLAKFINEDFTTNAQWCRCKPITDDKDSTECDPIGVHPGLLIHHEVMDGENGEKIARSALVLRNISPDDTGSYKCLVRNKNNEVMSLLYHLNVASDDIIIRKETATLPSFAKVPMDSTFPEKTDVVLECAVVGRPTPFIQWSHCGTRIHPCDKYKFRDEGPNASLVISGVQWYDSGKYKCHAINTQGEVSCTVDMFVQPPEYQSVGFDGSPMFLNRTQTTLAATGDTVTFACTVTGTPPPKVNWKKDGSNAGLISSQKYSVINSYSGCYTLRVNHATKQDEGRYICIAQNERGVAYCTAFLKFNDDTTGKSHMNGTAPAFVTRPHSLVLSEKSPAEFRTTVQGFPEPIVSWFSNNGSKIRANSMFKIEDIFGHHSLNIPSCTKLLMGRYTCTATNIFGETSCTFYLDVKPTPNRLPPVLQFGMGSLPTTAGFFRTDKVVRPSTSVSTSTEHHQQDIWISMDKTIKLSINVKSTTKAEVSWFKDGRQIKTGNRFSISKKDEVFSLRITRMKKQDEGLYSVMACNLYGISVTDMNIWVREKPKPLVFIKEPMPALTVTDSADATIKCLLHDKVKDGEAKWSKSGENIPSSSEKYKAESEGNIRKLTIKKATHSDSGDYSCQVEDQVVTTKLHVIGKDMATPQEDNIDSESMSLQQRKSEIPVIISTVPPEMEALESGSLLIQHTVNVADVGCTWLHNGNEVQDGKKYSVIKDGVKHKLVIHDITTKDAGRVKFTIKGKNGDFKSTNVFVKELPHPPPKCQISLCQKDLTKAVITWENPKQFNATEFVIEKYVISEKAWLQMDTVTCDTSSYEMNVLMNETCKVRIRSKNDVGLSKDASEIMEIKADAPLQLVHQLEDVTIKEGESAKFMLKLNKDDVKGHWKLNGSKVKPRGDTCMIECSGGTHTLVMRNLTSTGTAKVQFVTDDMKLQSQAELTVKGKPVVVIQQLKDVTVVENSDVTFVVRLSKDIRKTGTWYLNNNGIKTSENFVTETKGEFQIFTIKSAKTSYSGKVSFELLGEPQATSTCKLTVMSWFETEPFQKISTRMPLTTSAMCGDNAVFTVDLSSDKSCKPKWFHNKKEISTNTDKYQVKQLGNKLQLIIKDLKEDDAGGVECIVDKDKTETKLNLTKLPDVFSPSMPRSQELSVNETDKDVELRCDLTTKESDVMWKKDDVDISKSDNYDIINSDYLSVLRVKNISKEVSGKYVCASKRNAKDTVSFVLNVIERNAFFKQGLPSEITLTEGDKMQMEVIVNENDSDVCWLKDGVMLNSQINDQIEGNSKTQNSNTGNQAMACKFKISSNEGTHTLAVDSIKTADAGNYICETLHDFTSAKVIVNERPIEVVEPLENARVLENNSTSFQIKLSGKSKQEVVWKLGEKQLTPSDTCQMKSTHNTHTLTLRSVQLDDAGVITFQCGDITNTANLNVTVPSAMITKSISSSEATLGKEHIFSCEISNKTSQVEWLKDAVILEPNDKYVMISEEKSRKLIVKNISYEDGGCYTVQTSLDISEANLTVKEPVLEVVEELEDVEVMEESKASFSTRLSLENAQVIWKLNGREIKPIKNSIDICSEKTWHGLHFKKVNLDYYGVITICHGDKVLDEANLIVIRNAIVISRALRDTVANLGDDVELTCEVSSPDFDVFWFRNSLPIDKDGYDEDIEITRHGAVCKLVIRSVKTYHEASYTCSTIDGVKTTAELFVKLPDVKIIKPLEDAKIYLSENVTLTTEISSDKIQGSWFIDNMPMDEYKEKHDIIDQSGCHTLRLYNLKNTIVVSYHAIRNVKTSCCISVIERPVEITSRLQDAKPKLRENLKLTCEMSAPDLKVSWLFNKKSVVENSNLKTYSHGCKYTLEIVAMNYDWEGEYTCAYKNKKTSADVKVFNQRIKVLEPLKASSCELGSDVTLYCDVTRYDEGLCWKKDGKELKDAVVDVVKAEYFSSISLTIQNASFNDEGVYSLCHINAVLSEKKVELSCAPIDCTSKLVDTSVTDDSDHVMLVCEFSMPVPCIWEREGIEIQSSIDMEIISEGKTQKLKINEPQCEDSGIYACIARDAKTSCILKVESGITFIQELPKKITVNANEAYTFKCVLSNPVEPGLVKWIIGGKSLNEFLHKNGIVCKKEQEDNCNMLLLENFPKCTKTLDICFQYKTLSNSCHVSINSPPGPPQNVEIVDVDDCDVELAWDEPEEDTTVDHYKVFTSKNTESWQLVAEEDECSAVIEELESNVEYRFAVLSANEYGLSDLAVCEETFMPISPVEFLTTLKPVTIMEGHCLELSCQISRAVSAKTTWTLNGRILAENDKCMIMQDNLHRELIVENIDMNYIGNYCCEIDDELKTSCSVNIIPRLKVVKHLEDTTVVVGDDCAIECELNHDEVNYKWKMDDEYQCDLEHDRVTMLRDGRIHKITIKNCERSDACVIQFIASSCGETITSSCELTVTEPQLPETCVIKEMVGEEVDISIPEEEKEDDNKEDCMLEDMENLSVGSDDVFTETKLSENSSTPTDEEVYDKEENSSFDNEELDENSEQNEDQLSRIDEEEETPLDENSQHTPGKILHGNLLNELANVLSKVKTEVDEQCDVSSNVDKSEEGEIHDMMPSESESNKSEDVLSDSSYEGCWLREKENVTNYESEVEYLSNEEDAPVQASPESDVFTELELNDTQSDDEVWSELEELDKDEEDVAPQANDTIQILTKDDDTEHEVGKLLDYLIDEVVAQEITNMKEHPNSIRKSMFLEADNSQTVGSEAFHKSFCESFESYNSSNKDAEVDPEITRLDDDDPRCFQSIQSYFSEDFTIVTTDNRDFFSPMDSSAINVIVQESVEACVAAMLSDVKEENDIAIKIDEVENHEDSNLNDDHSSMKLVEALKIESSKSVCQRSNTSCEGIEAMQRIFGKCDDKSSSHDSESLVAVSEAKHDIKEESNIQESTEMPIPSNINLPNETPAQKLARLFGLSKDESALQPHTKPMENLKLIEETNKGDVKLPAAFLMSYEEPKTRKLPPLFIEEIQNQYVTSGQNAMFSCSVKYLNDGEAVWTKEDSSGHISKLEPSARIQLLSDNKQESFWAIIKCVEESDIGVYSCMIKSTYGKVFCSASLQVLRQENNNKTRNLDQGKTAAAQPLVIRVKEHVFVHDHSASSSSSLTDDSTISESGTDCFTSETDSVTSLEDNQIDNNKHVFKNTPKFLLTSDSPQRTLQSPYHTDCSSILSDDALSVFTITSWPATSHVASVAPSAYSVECPISQHGSGETISQIVQSMISMEETYVSNLQRAIQALNKAEYLPSVLEYRSREIFGDLEGIHFFHINCLLPEFQLSDHSLSSIISVFNKYQDKFEQTYLSHLVNTFEAEDLLTSNRAVIGGIKEVSDSIKFDLSIIPESIKNQLVTYQALLKKLTRHRNIEAGDKNGLQALISALSSIPRQAKLTQSWCKVQNPPDAAKFGKLLKEGKFQTLETVLLPMSEQGKMTQLFLFENKLVVVKLYKRNRKERELQGKYFGCYQVENLSLIESPDFADDRTFICAFDNEKWKLICRSQSAEAKNSWCKNINNAVHEILYNKVIVEQLEKNIKHQRGVDLNLHCKIITDPNAVVSWENDGSRITTSQEKFAISKNEVSGECSLKIHKAAVEDSGTYTCVVNYGGRMYKSVSNVFVSIPPFFAKQLNNQVVRYGEDIKLTCAIDGYPPPDVEWYKGGEMLVPGGGVVSKYKFIHEDREVCLLITCCTDRDLGNYKCKEKNKSIYSTEHDRKMISNEVGEAHSTAVLYDLIPSKPSSLLQVRDDSISASSSKSGKRYVIEETITIVEKKRPGKKKKRLSVASSIRTPPSKSVVFAADKLSSPTFTKLSSDQTPSYNIKKGDSFKMTFLNDMERQISEPFTETRELVIGSPELVPKRLHASYHNRRIGVTSESSDTTSPTTPTSISDNVFQSEMINSNSLADILSDELSSEEELKQRVMWIEKGQRSDSEFRNNSLKTVGINYLQRAEESSNNKHDAPSPRPLLSKEEFPSIEDEEKSFGKNSTDLSELATTSAVLFPSPGPYGGKQYTPGGSGNCVGTGAIARFVRAMSQNEFFDSFFEKTEKEQQSVEENETSTDVKLTKSNEIEIKNEDIEPKLDHDEKNNANTQRETRDDSVDGEEHLFKEAAEEIENKNRLPDVLTLLQPLNDSSALQDTDSDVNEITEESGLEYESTIEEFQLKSIAGDVTSKQIISRYEEPIQNISVPLYETTVEVEEEEFTAQPAINDDDPPQYESAVEYESTVEDMSPPILDRNEYVHVEISEQKQDVFQYSPVPRGEEELKEKQDFLTSEYESTFEDEAQDTTENKTLVHDLTVWDNENTEICKFFVCTLFDQIKYCKHSG